MCVYRVHVHIRTCIDMYMYIYTHSPENTSADHSATVLTQVAKPEYLSIKPHSSTWAVWRPREQPGTSRGLAFWVPCWMPYSTCGSYLPRASRTSQLRIIYLSSKQGSHHGLRYIPLVRGFGSSGSGAATTDVPCGTAAYHARMAVDPLNETRQKHFIGCCFKPGALNLCRSTPQLFNCHPRRTL